MALIDTRKKKTPFSFQSSPQSVTPQAQAPTAPGGTIFGFPYGAKAPGAGAPAIPPNPWGSLGPLLAPTPSQGIDFASLFSAMRNDPVADANRAYKPGANTPANPFSNGFFKDSAANMTPEARVASQGRSATNQWAQLGGVDGVDPAKLQGLMSKMTPTPGPIATPEAMTSDPFFLRRMQQMFPEVFGALPINPNMQHVSPQGKTPYGQLYR